MDTISVTVTEVPGTPTDVTLESGSSAADAVEAAGLSANGADVQVNGESYDLNDTVRDGDTITVSQTISGA